MIGSSSKIPGATHTERRCTCMYERFIENTKTPTLKQHVYTMIITAVIVVLYNQEKKLNDLAGSGDLDDKQIDHWNDICIGKLRSHLVLQAFQLPTVMEEIQMNTKINIDGKQIPKYSQRDRHMRPTVMVYRQHLTQTLRQAYNETWLKTDLVEVTNGMLNRAPFRREPP